MNVLIINTAEKFLETALISGSRRIYRREDKALTHSETLLPAIESLLTGAGLTLESLDYIAVCVGPGSFTGIRIGVVTAAALCNSLGIPAAPVNTMLIKAYNVDSGVNVLTALSGESGCAYAAEYGKSKEEIRAPRCIRLTDFAEFYYSCAKPLILTGCEDAFIAAGVPTEGGFFPESNERGLFAAAEAVISGGKTVAGSGIKAVYLRKSQAEREKGEV